MVRTSKRNKEFSPFCDEGQRSIPWNFTVAFRSLYYVSLKCLIGFNKKVRDEWRVFTLQALLCKVYPSTEKSITKVATFLRFFLWSVHLYSDFFPSTHFLLFFFSDVYHFVLLFSIYTILCLLPYVMLFFRILILVWNNVVRCVIFF